MSKINDGGNAFPACNEANVNGTMGMTLRDWFAGQALAGLCANPNESPDEDGASDRDVIASVAYELADAMLAAREAGQP